MNFSDLLGGMLQSGLTPSSGDRVRSALGGGGSGGRDILGGLAGMLGGQQAGGLGGALSGMFGGGGGGGGLGGVLGSVLGEAGRAVGGNQNLAIGGLGALAGALLGGGGKSMGGALGGGVMALLGTMAFQALRGSGGNAPAVVPLGLREPQTDAERDELERNAETVLRAMINAAKADGQIDAGEIKRIVGKLDELGADKQAQSFVLTQMQKPLETEALIAASAGRPELATQIYGASLLAIEVDTQAEKDYLAKLASGLRLSPEVVGRVKEIVGLQPA